MADIFAVAFGYLAGSVPFAFLLARRRGVDLRRVGSGNIGAANVLRTSGPAWAAVAVCLDGAKGALAVLAARELSGSPATPVAAGLAAVIGHSYPVWLRLHGGKGVATAAGAFAVLTPAVVVIAGGVFAMTAWVTRYISVGSLAGAATLAVGAAASEAPAVSGGAVIAALVIVHRHRGNIGRLVAGTERRIGQRM